MIFNTVKDSLGKNGFNMEADDAMGFQAVIAEAGGGDYLEIGVQAGGSACFVGTLKKLFGQSGRLYGVDNFQNHFSGMELVEEHCRQFDVKITVFVGKSDEVDLPDIKPVVVLIDGDHAYDWVVKDWNRFSPIARRFVCLHDPKTHPGVQKAIDDVCSQDPKWVQRSTTGNMAIFERAK